VNNVNKVFERKKKSIVYEKVYDFFFFIEVIFVKPKE